MSTARLKVQFGTFDLIYDFFICNLRPKNRSMLKVICLNDYNDSKYVQEYP